MRKPSITLLLVTLVATTAGASRTLAIPIVQQQQVGAFGVTLKKDPMNDTDRSSILTKSEGGRGLVFRCDADGLNVMYGWMRYFTGADDRISVMYRFTPAPAVSQQWSFATSRQAGFMPMQNVPEFVNRALGASTVVLRVTDKDGDQVTDEFKLTGLADALKLLPCYKPFEPESAEIRPVSIPGSVSGRLGPGDRVMPADFHALSVGAFSDVFSLSVTEQVTIEATMSCVPCRSTLVLVDSTGKKITAHSGYPGTIRWPLAPGTYAIWAGTTGADVGAYKLDIVVR
jgi:hypothetical protein